MARFPGVASATHLIAAYMEAQGMDFEYFDDGDFGLGRFIFDILYEVKAAGVMIFVSRDYGGKHLGARRFEIIRNVVDQALGKLSAAITRNPLLADPNQLHVTADPQGYETDENSTTDATNELDEEAQAAQARYEFPTGTPTTETVKEDNEDGIQQDTTKHKPEYKGTPIKQKGRIDRDYVPPPTLRRLEGTPDSEKFPFQLVSYKKGKDKDKRNDDAPISLGRAVEGGDAFKLLLARKHLSPSTRGGRGGRGGRGSPSNLGHCV
jgi:hypothetical protein